MTPSVLGDFRTGDLHACDRKSVRLVWEAESSGCYSEVSGGLSVIVSANADFAMCRGPSQTTRYLGLDWVDHDTIRSKV